MQKILHLALVTSVLGLMCQSLTAQTPTLVNGALAEGFIGEQICFPIDFTNTGGPGYGPYTRLIVPSELTFDNATFAGGAHILQNLGTITSAPPNNFVIDPIARSNSNSTLNDTIFAPVGSRVILLEYPVGSMVQGGVVLNSEVCLTVNANAPLGIPVDVCVQGMYEFGNTPTGINGPIAATQVCAPVAPILFRFDKQVNGSDGIYEEVPGGGPAPCHVHPYQLNVDIAAAGTLTGPIVITDVLPGELRYLGNISVPPGCTAVEPTIGSLGGTLTVTCNGAFNGSTAPIDMQVTFDATVSDTLDETICDTDLIENAASINVPNQPIQVDSVQTRVQHLILGHGNNTTGPVSIGQTVTYNIGFEITAFTAGVDAAVITFDVADGMVFNVGSVTWGGAPVAPANLTVAPIPGSTGSRVTVDVHAQNGANILPCASPVLQYTANVNSTYANGNQVLSRDRLVHTSSIVYDLVEGATSCQSGDSSPIDIIDISFNKTVNNSPPTGPGRNGHWWPSDVVQYRLELRVPSLDLADVVITDFFPLPIHNVTDLAPTFGTDVRFDPATCWNTPPVTYTIDPATNSLVLDFGDISNAVTGGCVDIVLLIDIPITSVPFADGLFHSNFMQVNSDNSSSDDMTDNVLTLIQVGAPDLNIIKGITGSNNSNVSIRPNTTPPNGNATNANAGDRLDFTLTVVNNGTAPGFDVRISDQLPPELTNCQLIAPNPVQDRNGNPVAFTGSFSGNTLNIAFPPPSDSISFSGSSSGNDLYTVQYTCDVIAAVSSGRNFENTAQVAWSSGRGSQPFPAENDNATVQTATPTMAKGVDYIVPNYSGTNNRATIGEVVAYEVQVRVPEGNLSNVLFTDQLDQGLAFVGVDSILICNSSGSANITTSLAGGYPAVQAGASITATSPAPQDQDRLLTLDFGNLRNQDTDNIQDTIKIYYRTIVINHPINQSGRQLNNQARFEWDNPNSTGGRSNTTQRSRPVTVMEPQLEVVKSFTPDEVLPGNNAFVTITVRHAAGSNAPAFDVNLIDILPTGMTFVSGFSAGGTANASVAPVHGGGTITARFDTIEVGQLYSMTFEVQASNAITPCFTLTNCANLQWESIARVDEAGQPNAFSSSLGVQRTGNPSNIGDIANTYTKDSCADLNVVIDNSFDPFITANTPICEGDRAVLSVQQYNGNIVRYNWSGPGVPVGFNNFQLVIDPVTVADTGTYFVYVELDGCVTDTSNSFQLQLRPQPPTPTIVPSDTTVCEGSSVQFSTTTIADQYRWTGPNGFTANSSTTPLVSPVTLSDAGRYTLVITNNQGCSSTPVSSTLTVQPRPTAPTLNNNGPICANRAIQLSTNVTASRYQWISPNGQDTITTINTVTIAPNSALYAAGGWTLVISDANGCPSPPSNTSTVVIHSRPGTPITNNTGPICVGDVVTLTSNTVTGATYAWYSDPALTNLVATSQNPTISGLTAAASPITYYVQINTNGCLSDSAATQVVVNANPAAPVPSFIGACTADTLFLSTNAIAAAYQWTGPNGFISGLENPFIANANSGNAGSYTVQITDANGCTNNGVVQVTLQDQPATPTLSNSGPVCEGAALTFTSTPYTGSTISYVWTTPTGPLTTAVPNLVINPTTIADSGTYSLQVTVNGCTSASNSTVAVVNANPTVPVVAANSPVCEGGDIQLSTTTNAAAYQWNGPNGYTSMAPTPPAITPAITNHAGLYSLVVTDVNGCRSSASTTTVVVNPAPARPAINSNTPICVGDVLTLSTNSTATSYRWVAPNGADTTTTSSTIAIAPNSLLYQDGAWTLVITDANGCSSMSSIPRNIVINTAPVAVSATNNGPVCTGAAVQLNANTISGASYAWYSDPATTNLLSTLQNPRFSNQTTTTTYYLVIRVNGCPTPTDSTTVQVLPTPAAPALPANFAVCEGGGITLGTTIVASQYNWTGPNGFASNVQNPAAIQPATLADGGIYTLSIIDNNGCQSADSSVTVTVNAAPIRPVLSNNSTICEGEILVLSTTTMANNYRWIAPNGLDTVTTTSNLQILATNTAYYQQGGWQLVVQNANGCVSGTSAPSAVAIQANPVVPIVSNNGPVCVGDAAMLNVSPTPNTSYNWYSDLGLTNRIGSGNSITVNNATLTTTYYVVASTNGCSSPVDSTIVQVFPVPVAPTLPANFAVCEGAAITLSTTTVANQYNWTGPNGFASNAQNPAVIQPATLAAGGIYTLSIIDNNGCQSADSSVTVTIDAAPNAPVLSNNSAICEGDTLLLSTTASASTYRWIAPNGLDTTTTNANLQIIPTNTAYYQSGAWTLIVQAPNNCPSAPSVPSSVVINSATQQPIATNSGPVCVSGDAVIRTPSAAGATYQWYSDAGLTNLIGTTASVTVTNITSDSTFYVVVSVNSCVSPAGATTVQVAPVPAAPAVPADFAVCEGDAITLSTNVVASQYFWRGPNGFVSNAQNPAVIQPATAADAGIYTLYIIDNNGCQSSDTTVTVIVNAPPASPVITSNAPLCNGDTLVLTSSTNCGQSQWIGPNGNSQSTLGTLGSSVLWTFGSTTHIPSNDPNYLSGDWYMVCIDTLTGCRSESNIINISINTIPAQPLAFNNGPICRGNAVQLTTANVMGASYAWYADSSLTHLVSTHQNPTLTNVDSNSTFYVTVTVNGCASSAGATSVQIHPTPATPDVPADFDVCAGGAIALNTTTMARQYFWRGPNGFASNAQNPAVIQPVTIADAGTYTLFVVDNNGCRSADSSLVVVVNAAPVSPVIISNSSICDGDTLVLTSSANCGQSQWIGPNGNSQGTLGTPGNSVLWTFGSATHIPSTNPNYLSGDWYMVCIDTLTGCRSRSNTINVQINPIPVVNAFNNGTICEGEQGFLSATPLAAATYAWYSDSSLTTLVATTRTVTLPNQMATATYYVVATVNGCASTPAPTTLEVRPALPAPVPIYSPLCQLDTLFLFANGSGNIANYAWTGPNGFVSSLENPVIPNAYAFNAGSYTLTVTDSLGCTAFATVEVTIYPKPATPTLTHNAPFCSGSTDLIVQTQAYFGTDVRYFWERPNGQNDTTLVPSLVIPNATVQDTGLYQLTVFIDGCISLPADQLIRIEPIPAIPVVPADFAVCEGDVITLTTTTNAAAYFWTGPNGFHSNLASPTVLSATAVNAGRYTLAVANAAGCRSADTSLVVAVNALPPSPTITSNSPLCNSDTLVLTSSTNCGQAQWIGPNGNSSGTLGVPGGSVLWTFGSTTRIPSNDPNYLSGDWYMICIDTLSGCRSESNTINVQISPIPATPVAFNNGPVCVGDAVQLSTASIVGASYAWYADSNLTTLVATSQSPTIVGINNDTTFYVTMTVNGCTSAPGVTRVRTHPMPPTPALPVDFAVCADDAIVLSTTTNATAYFWTGPNGFQSTQQSPRVLQATVSDAGVYRLYVVDNNGCRSADSSVMVTVNPRPDQPVLSSNSALCDGDSLVLSTTARAATYQWIAPDGADTLTTSPLLALDANSNYYQAGDWTLILMDTNGCHSDVSAPHTVIIYAVPANQAAFNNGPICVGDAATLLTSTVMGATYQWYSDAALTNLVATSTTATLRNLTTDSTFYLVMTRNGCRALVDSTTVLVYPTPATPAVAPNLTLCEGDALVLMTTTNASAYQWNGPNGFSSNQQSPRVVNPATVQDSGRYTLFITDANGCISGDTVVQVTINPLPAAPIIVTNNSPVCAGSTVTLSTNAGAIGTTYTWYLANGTPVGTGTTFTIASATARDAGDYYVMAVLQGCESAPSVRTTVIVDTILGNQSFAGNDQGICDSTTTILNATVPTVGTGQWTTSSGATIANPTGAQTAVYNLPAGNSTFFWALSNGACNDYATDSVIVTRTLRSTDLADAGLDQRLCGQTTVTLGATVPTTATGRWTQPTGQASQGVVITAPTAPNSTVTGLVSGTTYTFTWVLSNGNCGDYSSDQVSIQVDVAPPDQAYAGMDIFICNQNSVNLAAFASQYGTGVWTSTSSATVIDPTLASTLVVNLPQDTSVFVWTLSNGTCQDYSSDSMMIVVSNTTDTADAGLNQTVCSVNAVALGAVVPSAGTGRWSQTASQVAQGVVIVNPTDPNTQVVGLSAGSTYAFTWTISNGTCVDYSSAITTVTINATPPDNAFAGNDINLCGTSATTNLGASVPTIASGIWTTTSGATISNPTQPTTTVSGLAPGPNVFVWTLSQGSCIDYSSDTVVVTLTTPSGDVADAGLDSAYCDQRTVVLNAAAPSVGGGYWTQTPSQASLGATINNRTSPTSTVSNLTPGTTYTFTWVLTNGGCVDYSTDDVLIRIDALPSNVAYAGEDTILCGGNSLQLDGLAPPIGTGFWTTNDSATITTPTDPNTLVVNIQQDTTVYYWTLSNGACMDYSTDSVQVILSPASADLAFAGFDATLCGVDSIILSATPPTTSTGVWTQTAGQASQGVIITNPTDPNSSVTGIVAGQQYTFVWTLSTIGCPDFSSDNVVYRIFDAPNEVAYAGPDIVLCAGNSADLNANVPVFSTGLWTSSGGSAVIINPTLTNTTVVNLPNDTTAFYWSLSNGSCQDYSIDTMLVIVTPTFSVDTANAGLDIAICNADTAQLLAQATNVAIGHWTQPANQASAGVIIDNVNDPNTMVYNLRLDSIYTFTWSVSNGLCQNYDQDQVMVQVSSLPLDAAYAGEDFTVCGVDTAIVRATVPTVGTGVWATPTTGVVIVTPTRTETEVLNLALGQNMLIWTLSNGACRDYSTDTLMVTTDDAPVANADSFVLVYNSSGNTIDVTLNDALNNNWTITIADPINSGRLTNLGNGEFDVLLQDVLVDQRFIYQLCNPNCPAIYCDTALVILDVQGGTVCNIPNTITPNNDGANDAFIVPCLDGLEGTQLGVYNRWGDLLYETDNYQNNWDGTHNGMPVPDATYFYILRLADGRVFQGFVEVRR